MSSVRGGRRRRLLRRAEEKKHIATYRSAHILNETNAGGTGQVEGSLHTKQHHLPPATRKQRTSSCPTNLFGLPPRAESTIQVLNKPNQRKEIIVQDGHEK